MTILDHHYDILILFSIIILIRLSLIIIIDKADQKKNEECSQAFHCDTEGLF